MDETLAGFLLKLQKSRKRFSCRVTAKPKVKMRKSVRVKHLKKKKNFLLDQQTDKLVTHIDRYIEVLQKIQQTFFTNFFLPLLISHEPR